MEKDLTNFKNWFKNLSLEMKIEDSVLKKLMPPQRRDMWRHVMKHVLHKKKVELIKKHILLNKLHKRQERLMARVETEEDLTNALRYEKLMTRYKKIQKEVCDVKKNNSNLKTKLNEKNECKKNLIKNTELKRNTMYLIKHKNEDFTKLSGSFSDKSDVCNHFSVKADANLTETDYQDALIKCLVEVDNAKESGDMRDGVNFGKKLCTDLYSIIRDKSPKIFIETIEMNLKSHINEFEQFFTEESKIPEVEFDMDKKFDELQKKLVEKQLELKCKLVSTLTKRYSAIKLLKETKAQEKNEIINLYKLKNVSITKEELLVLEKKLDEFFQIVIRNSINNFIVTGLQDIITLEEETFKMLDDFLEKETVLNDEINENKNIVSEMLKELNDKKSDFGLSEIKSIMDQFAESYLKKNISDQINDKILYIKGHIVSVADSINKPTDTSTTKSSALNFQTLQDIKRQSEIIDVISKMSVQFERLNKTSKEKNVGDIAKEENKHKLEFNDTMHKIETDMLDLDSTIEDCKIVADVLSTKQLKDLV